MNLLSLLGVVFASGTLTLTQPQFRNNDTYQDVDVTTTYEYETNEVNSVSDLVDGNIYYFKYNLNSGTYTDSFIEDYGSNYFKIIPYKIEYIMYDGSICQYSQFTYIDNEGLDLFNISSNQNSFTLIFDNDLDSIELSFISPKRSYANTYVQFYFLCLDKGGFNNVDFINASDYLGDETTSITPIETEGFYNIFYQFLNERIFTGGYMDSMSSTILGQTITLGNWCSIAFSLIILTLILVFLIKFVIYLFKVVSSLFLWR